MCVLLIVFILFMQIQKILKKKKSQIWDSLKCDTEGFLYHCLNYQQGSTALLWQLRYHGNTLTKANYLSAKSVHHNHRFVRSFTTDLILWLNLHGFMQGQTLQDVLGQTHPLSRLPTAATGMFGLVDRQYSAGIQTSTF